MIAGRCDRGQVPPTSPCAPSLRTRRHSPTWGERQLAGAGWQAVGDALYRWTLEHHRTPNGGPQMILIGVPSAGDPPGGRGPDFDFAVALR